MKTILLIICLITTIISPVKQHIVLENYLISTNICTETSDITFDLYRQTFFEDVSFWEIDTLTTVSTSTLDSIPNLVLAIDKNANIFSISGFEKNNFDSLVYYNNPDIYMKNLKSYGKFYLEITSQFNFSYNYFISNHFDFVKLTDELFDIRYGYVNPNREKEQKIVKNLNFEDIIYYDPNEKKYSISYYIWNESKGNIQKYVMDITEDGYCEIVRQEETVKKIGCWRSYPN